MKVYLKQLLSFKVTILLLVSTFLYLFLSALIINYRLFVEIIPDTSSIFFKSNLVYLLFIGSFQEKTILENILTILTAFLFSVNLFFVYQSTKIAATRKTTKITFSSAMALSLLTSGCASCGVTVLSFIGPTVAASFLPFHGLQIQLLVIFLLGFSLWYTLRSLTASCTIR